MKLNKKYIPLIIILLLLLIACAWCCYISSQNDDDVTPPVDVNTDPDVPDCSDCTTPDDCTDTNCSDCAICQDSSTTAPNIVSVTEVSSSPSPYTGEEYNIQGKYTIKFTYDSTNSGATNIKDISFYINVYECDSSIILIEDCAFNENKIVSQTIITDSQCYHNGVIIVTDSNTDDKCSIDGGGVTKSFKTTIYPPKDNLGWNYDNNNYIVAVQAVLAINPDVNSDLSNKVQLDPTALSLPEPYILNIVSTPNDNYYTNNMLSEVVIGFDGENFMDYEFVMIIQNLTNSETISTSNNIVYTSNTAPTYTIIDTFTCDNKLGSCVVENPAFDNHIKLTFGDITGFTIQDATTKKYNLLPGKYSIKIFTLSANNYTVDEINELNYNSGCGADSSDLCNLTEIKSFYVKLPSATIIELDQVV